MPKKDTEQAKGLLKSLREQFGEEVVRAAVVEVVPPAPPGGDESRPMSQTRSRYSLLGNAALLKDIAAFLDGLSIPPGTEQAAEVVGEIIRWIFEPTKYSDFTRLKDEKKTDEVQLPEGEPRSWAPNVTAKIVETKCKPGTPGWMEVTLEITATSGADNDDIVSVNLSLPSPDCNGYRHRGLPHTFDEERERQTHRVTVDVKCSDVILRSEDPPDGFVWVQVEAVDDDGNSTNSWLKLSSPGLDTSIADCCRSGNGQPGSGS